VKRKTHSFAKLLLQPIYKYWANLGLNEIREVAEHLLLIDGKMLNAYLSDWLMLFAFVV
jgi:hypothetical protein